MLENVCVESTIGVDSVESLHTKKIPTLAGDRSCHTKQSSGGISGRRHDRSACCTRTGATEPEDGTTGSTEVRLILNTVPISITCCFLIIGSVYSICKYFCLKNSTIFSKYSNNTLCWHFVFLRIAKKLNFAFDGRRSNRGMIDDTSGPFQL